MAGGLSVNTAKMNISGKVTIENAGTMSDYIASLVSLVESLERNWSSGGGHNEFVASFEIEKEQLKTFAAQLDENGFRIVSASGIFGKVDQDVADEANFLGRMEV